MSSAQDHYLDGVIQKQQDRIEELEAENQRLLEKSEERIAELEEINRLAWAENRKLRDDREFYRTQAQRLREAALLALRHRLKQH